MTIEQEVKAIDEQIKRLLRERAALTEARIDYLDYLKSLAKACFDAEKPWPVERDQMGLFEEGET